MSVSVRVRACVRGREKTVSACAYVCVCACLCGCVWVRKRERETNLPEDPSRHMASQTTFFTISRGFDHRLGSASSDAQSRLG